MPKRLLVLLLCLSTILTACPSEGLPSVWNSSAWNTATWK